MGRDIPDFVIHYSRGEPFRSITSIRDNSLDDVLKQLNDTNAWGLARFSDPQYLSQRYQAEDELRRRFIDIGGNPALKNPIYFFLGRHHRFEQHERNVGYMILLRDIDPRTISFSYGDSMFCFNRDNRHLAGEKYQNPLCTQLFAFEDLPELFADKNFPQTDPLHIEAHLWVNPDLAIVRNLDR